MFVLLLCFQSYLFVETEISLLQNENFPLKNRKILKLCEETDNFCQCIVFYFSRNDLL